MVDLPPAACSNGFSLTLSPENPQIAIVLADGNAPDAGNGMICRQQ